MMCGSIPDHAVSLNTRRSRKLNAASFPRDSLESHPNPAPEVQEATGLGAPRLSRRDVSALSSLLARGMEDKGHRFQVKAAFRVNPKMLSHLGRGSDLQGPNGFGMQRRRARASRPDREFHP
jgi:hypothetical protein